MLQHLSLFMQSAGALLEGNLWLLIGIAAVACVLGIEVAGIGILIRKVRRAKKEKLEREEEERNGFYGAALMGAAAIPFSAETVLAILLGLSAVAAVVFTVLLIVFRSKGYDYISSKTRADVERRASEAAVAETPAAPPVELPAEDTVEETVMEAEEQIAETVEETETVETVEETGEVEQTEVTEAVADGEDLDFTVPEFEAAETEPEAEEEAVPAFATAEEGGMETVKETAGADSKEPVRVVTIEKTTRVKTETTKEFSDAPEADGAARGGASSDQTERLIQMIGTLAEKIDKVHLEAVARSPENVTVLAEDEPLPRDEEEDEDDDVALDDPADGDEEEGADTEDSERFTGNERIIGYDEATGCYIVAHYRKSFLAKMIQSKPTIKHYYSEMKNALLAYKGTKSRTSWAADSFHNGRTAIAKINVKTNILELYLALEPESLEGTVYKGKDVGHLKRYADTPFKYRVKSPRKFKWAMELIQRVCEEKGLSPIDIEPVDYEAENPFEETDALVARGLIKEYIRQQQAANTFELDDSHVPHVVDMDETVIPTSANVLWEFDNELLAQKEEELTLAEPEEAEEEPEAPVEEATAEETEETERTVARESVVTETTEEVTHVRYTERYFASEEEADRYHALGEEVLRGEFTVLDGEDAEDAEETVTEADEYLEEEIEGTEDSPEDAQELYEQADGIEDDEIEETSEEEEHAEDAESEDGESDLVSAFEAEATDPEDDLDWGIPRELLEQTPVVIEAGETEKSVEEATEEDADCGDGEETVEESPEESAEDEYGYGDCDESTEPSEEDETAEVEGEDFSEETPEDEVPAEEPDEAETAAEAEEDADGYYDEDGNYFLNDENATGYYDKDGNYILFDENATGYYDKDGNYILYDENATGYYDPNGNYIFYDENAAGYYDPNGNYVLYDTEAETDDGVYEDSTEALYAEEDAPEADVHEGYYNEEGEFIANETEAPATEGAIKPARTANPDVALVDLSVLEANFPAGSEIDLNALKAMGLVMQSAKILKICCMGEMTKPLTVIADQFTMEAIAAISAVGGDAQILKNKGGEN